MPLSLPTSVSGVATVAVRRGAIAHPDAPPALLLEVPHGADRRVHYDALRAQLRGPLPDQLEDFFFVNTDVGAWDLAEAVAAGVVERCPDRSVLLVRCLIPRTFVDTNRLLGAPTAGGLTPGLPVYVTDPDDQALLRRLHRRYVAVVDAAFAAVCARGGLAVLPHSYAPRSVGIDVVDADIVPALHAAWAPDVAPTWPLRPQIDLITRDFDGQRHAPPGSVEALRDGWAADGIEAEESATYHLHPASWAAQRALAWSGQVLCLEVRRDLLVTRWDPFTEHTVDRDRVAGIAQPLVRWLGGALQSEVEDLGR